MQVDLEEKVRVKEGKSYAASSQDLAKFTGEDEKKIVQIQANFRGYRARKSLKTPHFDEKKMLKEDGLEYRDEFTFENGAVYKGQWRGEKREGYGVQIWVDGAKYEGMWKNDMAHGKGKFWHVDGDIFEGEWENDKANGYGIYSHVNGAKYKGEWRDDLQEGKGTETWADGSRYEGMY